MRLFRRRFIPDELIELKDDEIVLHGGGVLVTKWLTLKPKDDFTHGASCCFLNEGYKISKMFGPGNVLRYYYCDVVKFAATDDKTGLIVTDLLIDVIVDASGASRIIDLDEAVGAAKAGLISTDDLLYALSALDRLLRIVYDGGFKRLTEYIDGLWGESI